MATFISNSIAGNNCYLIVCCLRTNNSNLFSSNSLLRKKKSTFLFFLSYSFPTYCILSVRNVKFYSLLNSSFIYKGKKKTFLGWRDKDVKHKACGTAFLWCAFTGSLEADLRQVLFQFSSFEGRKGGDRKARKRLKNSAIDSYGTTAKCHLPQARSPSVHKGQGFTDLTHNLLSPS